MATENRKNRLTLDQVTRGATPGLRARECSSPCSGATADFTLAVFVRRGTCRSRVIGMVLKITDHFLTLTNAAQHSVWNGIR